MTQKDHQTLGILFDKKWQNEKLKLLKQRTSQQSFHQNKLECYKKNQLIVSNLLQRSFIQFLNEQKCSNLPSIIDGLRKKERKILFTCLSENIIQQTNLVELASVVMQKTNFPSQQLPVIMAILKKFAQNFTGAYNLPLPHGIGQFGTRYLNGKDHGPPFSLFAHLHPLTRYLFSQIDDNILQYVQQESKLLQPKFYFPILPLLLINGFQPMSIIQCQQIYLCLISDMIDTIRSRIKLSSKTYCIGFERFKGRIVTEKKNEYEVYGQYEIDQDNPQRIIITEIPIYKSITDYKKYLQERLQTFTNPDHYISQIKENHYNNSVQFAITFLQNKKPTDLLNFLKLKTTIKKNGFFTLLDQKNRIKSYEQTSDIIESFYQHRLQAYSRRKLFIISKLQRQFQIVQSRIGFIDRILQGKFRTCESQKQWIQQLISSKFIKQSELTKVKSSKLHKGRKILPEKIFNFKLEGVGHLFIIQLSSLTTHQSYQ